MTPARPTARPHVVDTIVDTANEFLDVLSPRHVTWCDEARRWVFRGQRDAEWKLTPSALRLDAKGNQPFKQFGFDPPLPPTTAPWSARATRHNRMLRHLLQALNHQGLTVPFRNPTVDSEGYQSSSEFPHHAAFPLMALAQHHGLPTLLLDWSRRAWVAAYFAAASAAEPENLRKASHLAVWALLNDSVPNFDRPRRPGFFEAPTSTNQNLRAQSGLFTFVMGDEDATDRTHDEHVAWLCEQGEYAGVQPLRRFLLPASEAPLLLRLLATEGITGATTYPGVDGIVRAMREQTYFDKPVT